ncbi:MAG: CocE/NonD family hydrolase [Spirochaetota bacterium]
MRVVRNFPYRVRHVEHTLIPMRDGVSLAARLWIPEGVSTPVPALLEFIPYRKRDMTRGRDALTHPYFAGHGYASVRVDLRGSGDSQGLLTDEYLREEQLDALDILAWLGRQPWCNGRVGMFGISWGGFNALQVAALRPPQLGAIITVCSTDDRYADDVHYMGGCLLGDNLSWASTMFAYNSCPPDPELVPEWRGQWMARLEGSGLWLDQWLRHQRRDDYYRHGSICENYEDVQIPVLAVSGWADGYTNAVFRLLEGLSAPSWGLIGPWGHTYPHIGVPGPAIGFLQESLRFWDRWLAGEENGYEGTPRLRAYMQGYEPPAATYAMRPGYWFAIDAWPAGDSSPLEFSLRRDRLVESGPEPQLGLSTLGEAHVTVGQAVRSPLTVGQFAGKWCSYTATPDLPGDQREEDGGSLVYDTDPLSSPVEVVGRPCARIAFEPQSEEGTLAVRLSDVAPTGEAYRVTYGVINLTHHRSHGEPEALVPGAKYVVDIALNGIAHRFPVGNRIRLSVSTSYWPLIWTPMQWEPVTILLNESALRLPLWSGDALGSAGRVRDDVGTGAPLFGEPESAAGMPREQRTAQERNWTMTRDLGSKRSSVNVVKDDGAYYLPEIDLEITNAVREQYTINPGDPYSAQGHTDRTCGFSRDGWRVRTETRTTLRCDAHSFIVEAELDAYESDTRVFSENYHRVIPRDHV